MPQCAGLRSTATARPCPFRGKPLAHAAGFRSTVPSRRNSPGNLRGRGPAPLQYAREDVDDEALEPAPEKPSGQDLDEWPEKSDLYVVRTDGNSCSRELVAGRGKLSFAYPSTYQYLLVWRHRPHTVMVIKKLGPELFAEFLEIIRFLIEQEGMRVVVEPSCYATIKDLPGFQHVYTYAEDQKDSLAEYVDFLVCLGGDGTLLHATHAFSSHLPPVIAFQMGSLGFLGSHHYVTFKQDIRAVIYGNEPLVTCLPEKHLKTGVNVSLRMRLLCEVTRRGESSPCETHEVLNECVVDRGSASYLSNIKVYEHGKYMTSVQADGVMLATPTGSTAYSVAAGGSMVHPNVPGILFTPICPHTLSFRPIILPDYTDIELKLPDDARAGAWVSFDGRARQKLRRGDSVRVRMSPNPVPTIDRVDQTADWLESLHRCFGWNDRLAQKPMNTAYLDQENEHN